MREHNDDDDDDNVCVYNDTVDDGDEDVGDGDGEYDNVCVENEGPRRLWPTTWWGDSHAVQHKRLHCPLLSSGPLHISTANYYQYMTQCIYVPSNITLPITFI